jgi:succinyl-diaminopimelate desuccinylase
LFLDRNFSLFYTCLIYPALIQEGKRCGGQVADVQGKEAVSAMREIVELTRDLIRFKTVSANPGAMGQCADFIQAYLKRNGIVFERFDHQGVPSIAVLPKKGWAPVLLMSHIDVVDGPDALFDPVEKDDKLFGRGSSDDKYAVALSMVLVKQHLVRLQREAKTQADLPFGILITGDEETGGVHGAKTMLETIRADFCIALDGGRLNKIVTREKGILRIRIISRGKAAHGARPWLGENAIDHLIADYQGLKTLFAESAPDHWHRTVNFGIASAGKAVNQVPDRAEGLFDIRYTESDDVDGLIDAIRKTVDSEVVVEECEPVFDGGASPYLDLLLEVAKGATTGFEHGASDARYLSARGIAGVVWGADGDMSAHSVHEHINLDSVQELYQRLNAFVTRVGERKIGA